MFPVDSSQSRGQGSFVIIIIRLFLSSSASEEILVFKHVDYSVCVFLNSANIFKAWKKNKQKALFLLTLLFVKCPQKWKQSNNPTALIVPPTSVWWKTSLDLQAGKNAFLGLPLSFLQWFLSYAHLRLSLCWRPNPESSAFLASVIPLS